jgi:phosphoglycerate dehydrogenase-like enzyme
MKYIAHDPYADPQIAESLGIQLVGLDEVFKASDILTVNCPLNEETRNLVSAKRLALMKSTAYFINTARGPIVDQKALTNVLSEGRIAGAGLDVFEVEPISADDPLLKLDSVITTPHALCMTDQCIGGVGAVDIKAVLDVMNGREPVGIVNKEIIENTAWRKKLDGYRAAFGSG